MAAVEVFGVVTSVIATLGAIISSVGAAAPLLSLAGAHGMFAITGLSTSAVLAIVETAAVAGPVVGQAVTAAGFLKTVVSLSVDAAAQDGYVSIPLERNTSLASIVSAFGSKVIASAIGRMTRRCK
jgi:hypothetical protein